MSQSSGLSSAAMSRVGDQKISVTDAPTQYRRRHLAVYDEFRNICEDRAAKEDISEVAQSA
jgi:hypothetical protein